MIFDFKLCLCSSEKREKMDFLSTGGREKFFLRSNRPKMAKNREPINLFTPLG